MIARIATVCQGRTHTPDMDQNRARMLERLDLALTHTPDLVCLPETFTLPARAIASIDTVAEPIDGPTVSAVSARAQRHRCQIVCPQVIRHADGRCVNAAVLLGRDGAVVGIYEKAHPVTSTPDYTALEWGTSPGPEIPPVFDLDFGRVGIQICFDIGFPEQWDALARQGAKAVFWPSAYDGGYPLRAYAALHRIYVVSAVRTAHSRMIDPCGTVLEQTDAQNAVIVRDINLDFAVCHYDFNYAVPDRLRAAYPGRVAIRSHDEAGLFLVEPTDPTLTVAQLQAELGFESADAYHERHRAAAQALREGGPAPVQNAPHGDRPMWGR